MSLASVIYSVGAVPILASRPFLASFLTALLARLGPEIPRVRDLEMVRALAGAPEWFTSGGTLAVLAVLAALEWLSASSPEIRRWLDELDGWIKSAVAVAVSSAVLGSDTAEALEAIQHNSVLSLVTLGALTIGGLTWLAAGLRRVVMQSFLDVDEDDDIGLLSLVHWVESAWTVGWLLVLLLLPFVALALSALTALGLGWAKRRAAAREAAARVACAGCGAKLLPHALACPACGRANAEPRAVGVFGQPKDRSAGDPAAHRFRLVARKRCPRCAARLPERAVRQACPECKLVTFADQAEFEAYLAALRVRLPKALLVCFLLGLVPVVGVIPGVIYFRLNLISGVRGYIPPLRGCLTRAVVRVVDWGLIALQPIPLLGALVLPIMCWTNFAIYRGSLRSRAAGELAGAARAAAPPA
jgi:Zn finger protein HypA/HybF involved in hydrogenase expression